MWGEQDSNLRSLTTTELQSVPFGRSGISPVFFIIEPPEGFEPTTPRLQITCSGQLSYGGKKISKEQLIYICIRFASANIERFFEIFKIILNFFSFFFLSSFFFLD